MGSFVPIAFQALQAFQTVGAVAKVIGLDDNNEKQNRLAVEQLQDQQRIANQRAAEKAALDKHEIEAKAAEAETKRRQALKRAVARQRAEFGASGVSSEDGSSEAVLLGLFEESEEQKSDRERLDNIKKQAIDQDLTNTYRVNTLKRTQLAERAKLKDSRSTLETVSDLLNIF